MRPSKGLGEQGKGHLFQGNRGTNINFDGNGGTKTILGNRKQKKTNFRILGNRGKSKFISGKQGNRYPPPWEGLVYINMCSKRLKRHYWGTGNTRKQVFDLGGTGEQANLFQWNKGTCTPSPWVGLVYVSFIGIK